MPLASLFRRRSDHAPEKLFGSFTVVALFLGASNPVAAEYSHSENAELAKQLAEHPNGRSAVGEEFSSEPLSCLYYRNATVDHIIPDQNGTPRILFTSVQTTRAGYYLHPNILHFEANGMWLRTPVPRSSDGWTHIHQSAGGMHIVLAMDNVPESAGWETRFVLSDDGGSSWSYGESIRKYVYSDVIRYFKMDDAGAGTAVEEYIGDVGGYEQAGYYIFETDDWGASWSDARYETSSFDASGYVGTYESIISRKDGRRPLADVSLPNFDCSG